LSKTALFLPSTQIIPVVAFRVNIQSLLAKLRFTGPGGQSGVGVVADLEKA
jgi:hypothetical protein